MTHDHTYLSQLPTADLLDHAFRNTWTGPELHMIRALAERLDEVNELADQLDAVNELADQLDAANFGLQTALADAERRADAWRDEAQAIQRQLDMVRG